MEYPQITDRMVEYSKNLTNDVIIENSRKMGLLSKNFGAKYYIMLADLINEGNSIQDSINKCYNNFFLNNDIPNRIK